MIAVDTNILVYAHRQDSPWHQQAKACVRLLAEGNSVWAIAWPSIHEFMSISTHRKVYVPASTIEEAIRQVELWMESPRLALLAEHSGHWGYLKDLARVGKLSGGKIHDARIAAICLQHGVSELWTADRDFSLFPVLKTRNPLVAK